MALLTQGELDHSVLMNTEQLRTVAEFASLAPSVHNTQPWRFVASEHALEVRADPSRRLDYLDGDTRQLHISCGAAVEFARLAIRALGYACVVRLAPARRSDVARHDHGGTPVPAKPNESGGCRSSPTALHRPRIRTTTGPSLTTSSFA